MKWQATYTPKVLENNETAIHSSNLFLPNRLYQRFSRPIARAVISASHNSREEKYPLNMAAIREFMTQCFTEEDLRRIVFDDPELKPAHNLFGGSMGKDQIIQRVLEYAETRQKIDYLLQKLKVENYDGYNQHRASIEPGRLTRDKKAVSFEVKLPFEEITKEDIARVIEGIVNELHISPNQVQYVHIQSIITVIISVPNDKADQLRSLSQQKGFEIEKEEAQADKTRFSFSSIKSVVPTEEELKREIAYKLNISIEEIYFEYRQSTLVTIALPKKNADGLIRLSQAGQLERWKETLKVVELKPEKNLERYIQIVATLLLTSEMLLSSSGADQFKRIIASKAKITPETIRLVTWRDRTITFSLVLPQKAVNTLFEHLKIGNLKDIGIQDFKTIHAEKDREEILCKLSPALLNNNTEAILYSKSTLAEMFALKIYKILGVELKKESILWQDDRVTFTFALPSREADILFHKYRTQKLKRVAGFEIQDFQIGQYDWDNYLGLVLVTSK